MLNRLNNSTGVMSKGFIVETYNSSYFKTMKVSDLFKYLQELASKHSDDLGIGFDDLIDLKGAWVLTKQIIDISRLPKSLETFTVYTWCSKVTKITAIRNFMVVACNGDILAKAKTEWVVINLESRRIIPMSKINLPEPTKIESEFYNNKIDKIKIDGDELISSFDKKVRFTDIDINGHMNNTVYLDMVIDSVADYFKSYKKLKVINSNFIKEAKFGDEVRVESFKITDTDYVHQIINITDNTQLFKATTQFI